MPSALRASGALSDPEETHDLAKNASFADIFHQLLTRFRSISSTGMPMAGLPSPILAVRGHSAQIPDSTDPLHVLL
eukprot:COSAG01_NODE_3226_length_6384_cov_10.417979_7_plen_76_part_00